jgi:hypothetical protein
VVIDLMSNTAILRNDIGRLFSGTHKMRTVKSKGDPGHRKITETDDEIPRMVFESLKPLKAVCVENDYGFMAYLIEMTEAEAYRLMRAQTK